MTSNSLATTAGGHGSALVLQADQDRWNDQQLAALRQLGLEDAPEGDLAVFFHVAQRTGLDVFAKQIHMIGRNSKSWDPQTRSEKWETKYTIQTGIDGYRVTMNRAAQRAGDVVEYADTEWCGEDGQWVDAWVSKTPPVAARVVIFKNGRRNPGTAMYSEYVQTYTDKKTQTAVPNSMWAKMPAGQLAKCAEALAIRRAYPQDFAALYLDEEMGQADNPPPAAPQRGGLSGALAGQRGGSDRPESPVLDMKGDLAKRMFATLNDAGISEREKRLEFVTDVLGREFTTTSAMTDAEAEAVIAAATDIIIGSSSADVPPPAADDPVDAELVDEPGKDGGDS